jgi:hypothetical protein
MACRFNYMEVPDYALGWNAAKDDGLSKDYVSGNFC